MRHSFLPAGSKGYKCKIQTSGMVLGNAAAENSVGYAEF
jgi:hypothetical protein